MALLFLTPLPPGYTVYFNLIPGRSLVLGLLFWGFTHIWLVSLKKQMKSEMLRRKAFVIVTTAALLIMLASEANRLITGRYLSVAFADMFFDLIGFGLGILSFRLLYTKCY